MADPHTIRFNTESVGGGPLGAQPAVPQMGVQGGGNTGATTVRRGADWFQNVGGMETDFGGNLPEFVQELAEPALEARRTQQMWEGFTAARSGKQMEEITESQPWYTRIFGPTNYEIGAQHFHVQKQAADVEQDIIRRMPELRQLTSQEMAHELQRISQDSLMGNAYADSLLQKMLMERAGPIMDLHTKERSAWENHELLRLQVDAATTQAAAFQAIMERTAHLGEDHPDFLEAAERQQEAKLILADTLMTSRYQTPESIYAFHRAVGLNAAQTGQFYVLRQLEEFGLLDALNIEQREDYLNTVNAAKSRYKANLPMDDELIRMRSEWMVEAGKGLLSAEEALAGAHAINDRWKARTGDTDGLIALGEAQGVAGSALSAFYQAVAADERERQSALAAASTEMERERLRIQQVERDTGVWKDGGIGAIINQGTTTRDNAETIAITHYDSNPQEALVAAVRQYGFPNHKFVSERLKTALRQSLPTDPQSEWTPAIGQAYAAFKVMENTVYAGERGVEDTMTGRNAAREYFGDENVRRFRRYETNLARGMSEDVAWSVAQRAGSDLPVGRGELTSDQYDLIQKQLKDSNFLVRAITGVPPTAIKGVLLQSAVQQYPEIKRTYPDVSDEQAAAMAVQAAKNMNVDTAGEFNWLRPEGMQPIGSYAQEVDPDVYGIALRQHIDRRFGEAGIKLGDDTEFYAVRTRDRDGFPTLVAWAFDPRTQNHVEVDFSRPDFEDAQRIAVEMEHKRLEAQKKAREEAELYHQTAPYMDIPRPARPQPGIGERYDTVY